MLSAFEIATCLADELGGGIKRITGEFMVRCPAHKERTGSLSLCDTQNGRLLWKCFGGCSQEAVRDALIARGLIETYGSSSRSPSTRRSPPPSPSERRDEIAESRKKALFLWRKRRPTEATIAETYLREHRGIRCPLPCTLGFLPGDDRFPSALIAAFGIAHESEPGVIAIAEHAVMAVHLIRLTRDGRKHPEVTVGGEVFKPKITIGRGATGSPIVLAPMNDLLGLAICEGIEDALSIHEATGLGAWAAGSADRMPALADAVPDYCDCCTIFAHADKSGQENAAELSERLNARGIEVIIEGLGA